MTLHSSMIGRALKCAAAEKTSSDREKMGVLLEIKAGPFAGKKIAVVTGQTVTFGRAAGRAEFALPHDTFMSGVHFAVECGASGCRVQDRKSSNGTFLNGAKHSGCDARQRRRNQRRANDFRGENRCRRETCVPGAAPGSCAACSVVAGVSWGRAALCSRSAPTFGRTIGLFRGAVHGPRVSAPVFSAPRPPVETPKPLHGGRAAPGEGEKSTRGWSKFAACLSAATGRCARTLPGSLGMDRWSVATAAYEALRSR